MKTEWTMVVTSYPTPETTHVLCNGVLSPVTKEPSFRPIPKTTVKLTDIMVTLGWAPSKTKARALLTQGAITDGFWDTKIKEDTVEKEMLDNVIYIKYSNMYKAACIQLIE